METPNNIALSPETLVSEMQTPPSKVVEEVNDYIRKNVIKCKGKLTVSIYKTSLCHITENKYSYLVYENWLESLAEIYRGNGWNVEVKPSMVDWKIDRLELSYDMDN